MGTNYYLELPGCDHCGRGGERLHIGKSSAGWVFALRVYPERNLHSLSDWRRLLDKEEGNIRDEYDKLISPDYMIKTITERSWPYEHVQHDMLSRGMCEIGPNNLLRSKIGYGTCIGWGKGTWEYCEGEFC